MKQNISESEWRVLDIIWDNYPITSREVVKILEADTKWHPNTVKTLIKRLIDKGYVGKDIKGNKNYYYPLISKKKIVKMKNKDFINQIYNGSFSKMIASFLDDDGLSNEEIEFLRKSLENMSDKLENEENK